MKIGPGVSELWGVENRPLPLTRPMAYTTACTTVQAVIFRYTVSSEKLKPDSCKAVNLASTLCGTKLQSLKTSFSDTFDSNFEFSINSTLLFHLDFDSAKPVIQGHCIYASPETTVTQVIPAT